MLKSRKRKIIWSSVISVILVALLAGGVYAASIFMQFRHVDIDKSDEALGIDSSKFDNSTDITNIALYGIDDSGNSDSIMIISLYNRHNKVMLISILRDSIVKVQPTGEDAYYTKINEAYSAGGPTLAIKTLNQNFGLNVTDYASIEFEGMVKIIDAVGGIDMTVTPAEEEEINGLIASTPELSGPLLNSSGEVHLNGNQAVAYSRIRHIDNTDGQYGDYGRTDRQRAVMEKLFEKALQMDYSQYPAFIQSVLPYLETSLSVDQILDLAGILTRDNVTFEQTRVPMTEYTINSGFAYNGKSTVYYNVSYAGDLINAFIYDDIPPETYLAEHPAPTTGALDEDTETSTSSGTSSKSKSSSSTSSKTKSKSSTSQTTKPSSSSQASESSKEPISQSSEDASSSSDASSQESEPPDDAPQE